MSLSDWHQRLEGHFEGLRRQRSEAVGDRPIFALEHGLDEDEVAALEADVRAHIRDGSPSKKHSLPWIVYAAEIGYRYAGDEYWQTFEIDTPGWVEHGTRSWIRAQFLEFHRRYGGAKPTGRWAESFSIICWPITHAILPCDLQRQLARILYELRHSFSANLFDAPEDLGQLIAARSWNASARFRQLTEEPILVGQIAAALLIEDAQGSKSLILPTTLRRIGQDLERERQARHWLSGARKLATRAQLRGLSAARTASRKDRESSRQGDQITALAVEPRLFLRPASHGRWETWLEIPDLSPLLSKFPALRDVFAGSRCVVSGSSGRPLWQGRLLRGPQRVRLSHWPRPSDPLLRFERSSPDLDYLLRTDCLLRPGPTWLFRIASDGLAYELRGNLARPGQSYILVSTDSLLETSFPVLDVACEGVTAIRVDVPQAVSNDDSTRLQTLGVRQARSVELWPAGLAAAAWDGEGRAEWLTSDSPCVGVRADHPLRRLHMSLNAGTAGHLDIPLERAGEVVFIELPELPAGVHQLQVEADSGNETQAGYLDIVVREPQSWEPGVTSQGALLVLIDPVTPSLEDLWEGRVSIEVHGPPGREVACTVALYDRRATQARVRKRLQPLPLPVTTAEWQQQFERQFRRQRDVQAAYDLAHSCTVSFAADDLGRFAFTCEREFTPLRWAVRRTSSGYELTLVDDRSVDSPPDLSRYEFRAPDRPISLESTGMQEASTSGGMYVARSGDYVRAVIVPPTVRSLEQLRVVPDLTIASRSVDDIVGLFSLASLWHGARLTGDHLFAAARRRDVVLAFVRQAFKLLGGENWLRTELRTHGQRDIDALQTLKQAISHRPHERGLGAKLMMSRDELCSGTPRTRAAKLAELATRFLGLGPARPVARGPVLVRSGTGPGQPEWLCELALRLASCSDGTAAWAGEDLREGIAALSKAPALARAARFVVLLVDATLPPTPLEGGPVYPGWEWE